MRTSHGILALLALAASAPRAAHATLGADISQALSLSSAQCLLGKGFDFIIVRVWCSDNTQDPNGAASIKTAQVAGMQADGYIFPCAQADPGSQIHQTLAGLSSAGVSINTLWLDIETNPSDDDSVHCGWSSSTSDNCNFIGTMISTAQAMGQAVGVYASEYMWSSIAGSDCTVGASVPLWYPHYDFNPSFSDFSPFGGWTSPTRKQYSDQGSACGIGYDKNYDGSGPNSGNDDNPAADDDNSGSNDDTGAGSSCNSDDGSGTCINTNKDSCSGTLVSGDCPGPANIECCVSNDYGSCSSDDGATGTCIDVNSQTCSGDLVSGLCPGPSNIQCCETSWGSCNTDDGSGTCIDVNSESCSGSLFSGDCPGPSNIQCCVGGAENDLLLRGRPNVRRGA